MHKFPYKIIWYELSWRGEHGFALPYQYEYESMIMNMDASSKIFIIILIPIRLCLFSFWICGSFKLCCICIPLSSESAYPFGFIAAAPFSFPGFFSLFFFWSMKNRWENNLCAIFDNIIERKSLWERVFGFHFYFNFFLVLCSFIWFFRSENQWRKYFSFTKRERRFHYYQIQKHCVCARIWWWWWW